MKKDTFYELLELLDDDLVVESAKSRRRKWLNRFVILGIILVVILFAWFAAVEPTLSKPENIGGAEGRIQDGVYYTCAGGGVSSPHEKLPEIRGIYRYTPGKGRECLVSTQDHRLADLFPCWEVNSCGLYFVDMNTDILWRIDLETKEKTQIYALEKRSEPDVDLSLGELLEARRTGEYPESLDYNAYIMIEAKGEEELALHCSDGMEPFELVLDCQTGELSEGPPPAERGSIDIWMTAGERIFELKAKEYPDGFAYPGWEEDVTYNEYFWLDLLENGTSVLPEGTEADETEIHEIGDGILVGYLSRNRTDENGEGLRWATNWLLLTADGQRELPMRQKNGQVPQYLAVTDHWLFYSLSGVPGIPPSVQVMDLNTGESYEVASERYPSLAVTDGTWFYVYSGTSSGATSCYKLEYNEQGVPCGLTLVEENI